MGQPCFYHATVALSFQIEIYNLDRTKASVLHVATHLFIKKYKKNSPKIELQPWFITPPTICKRDTV